MMADLLVEIERDDWPALRDLYARNSPATFVAHNLIENFISWTTQQPDIPGIVFYSLNGDWSDGTFAANFREYLYIFTLAASSERLRKLFDLFDFSNGFKIHGVLSKDYQAVLDVIESKNVQLNYNYENLLHYLPADEALNFNITPPEGITLKPLEQAHLDMAEELWPYREHNTPQYLQLLGKFNPSVGAFTSDGRMVAWIFRHAIAFIGALQVDKEFLGRGLGMLVSKALSRKIAESGQDVGANIFLDNAVSLALFKKIGFKIVDRIYFIETRPL